MAPVAVYVDAILAPSRIIASDLLEFTLPPLLTPRRAVVSVLSPEPPTNSPYTLHHKPLYTLIPEP